MGTRHLYLLSTLSDIAQRQRSCDETGLIITYLETKELPDDDKHVRQILLTADQYVIIDDVRKFTITTFLKLDA